VRQGPPWLIVDNEGVEAAVATMLDGSCELRYTRVNGGSFRVLLQLGWGEDEVSQLWIGEERHEERPSLAMAAASPRDSGAVARSPVIELGQEDLGRGQKALGASSR
jgi:hypothetical protein